MIEDKLFEGENPHVSTFLFHENRPRARHLEEAGHQGRLHRARDYVESIVPEDGPLTVSDLGCGDGGLLSLVQDIPGVLAWGYDFHPASQEGWQERGVTAYAADVFNEDFHHIKIGEAAVMTEVLEHLARPRYILELLWREADYLVCSSPRFETKDNHDPCHAWAWDMEGYAQMITEAGWQIDKHEPVGLFQVVLAH